MTKTESYTFRLSSLIPWSTQYGMGDQNSALDICTNEYYVWIVGSSSKDWTFEQFDDADNSADYYRELNFLTDEELLPDATIARFDIQNTTSIGLTKPTNIRELLVFPNPTLGLITIDVRNLLIDPNQHLLILDIRGEIIEIKPIKNSSFIQVDLSAYSAGVYLINIIGQDTTLTTSIIRL